MPDYLKDSFLLLSCFQSELPEAGCDEAGRGCLAGPVVAAAVILPPDFRHPLLNDSKQLKPEVRDELRICIEAEALAWSVAFIDNHEIDAINILQATYKAMHQAISTLMIRPELLLIDGNRFLPYLGITHHCIVKGDSKYASIAAASILAKTHRDEYMHSLHNSFPCYGWDRNKGYGTPCHVRAIREKGLCDYHRRSFKLKSFDSEALTASASTEL